MRRFLSFGLFFISGAIFTGCATTPTNNYQSDIDSLNTRVSTLQGQLSAKDQEIQNLQNQVSDQERVLSQSEKDRQALSQKLDDAMMSAKKASEKPAVKADDSYLK